MNLSANVIIFRTFSDPIVLKNAIVIETPDTKRILSVTPEGRVLWRLSARTVTTFGELSENEIYLQRRGRVFAADVTTGKERQLGAIARNELIAFDSQLNLAYSVSARFDQKQFVVRDPVTLQALWSDDRVEQVIAATESALIVLTAVRTYDKEGYRAKDAAARALARSDGHELWSVKLSDERAYGIRAQMVERWFVCLDGDYYTGRLLVLDPGTGRSVAEKKVDGLLDLESAGPGQLQVLIGEKPEDRIATLTLPELSEVASMPVPARENLFFHRDGPFIVTSGIYSIAAFNSDDGKKLWEQNRQLLIAHPRAGVMYASYSDREQHRAVLERIDLASGRSTELYFEPLPPERKESAIHRWRRMRAEERAARAEARAETERRQLEERIRPTIGRDLCLRFDDTPLAGHAEYFHLFPDGRAEYVDANSNFRPLRMKGRWWKEDDGYEISEMPLVADISTDSIKVDVGVLANVELLSELEDVIDAFLKNHPSASVLKRDVNSLTVQAPPCPEEARSYCDAAGNRRISLAASGDQVSVPREELERIRRKINTYVVEGRQDRLRFQLKSYRSYYYAVWLAGHNLWRPPLTPEIEIDAALESRSGIEPWGFRVAPCTEVMAKIGKLRNIIDIPSKTP